MYVKKVNNVECFARNIVVLIVRVFGHHHIRRNRHPPQSPKFFVSLKFVKGVHITAVLFIAIVDGCQVIGVPPWSIINL